MRERQGPGQGCIGLYLMVTSLESSTGMRWYVMASGKWSGTCVVTFTTFDTATVSVSPEEKHLNVHENFVCQQLRAEDSTLRG